MLEFVEVAFNEWGHSLWMSEEFFSVPFHWPFVTYGWLASGMFAVWGETILRLFQIEKRARSGGGTPDAYGCRRLAMRAGPGQVLTDLS